MAVRNDTVPSPDQWSTLVTPDNVHTFPVDRGFFVGAFGRRFRPVHFVMTGLNHLRSPALLCADVADNLRQLTITYLPHVVRYADRRRSITVPDGTLVTLHHRKGGRVEREAGRRILRITAVDQRVGEGRATSAHPATRVRYGEHPDHPGEEGFYLGVEHVGATGIHGIVDLDTTQYLKPELVTVKYFPIDPAVPTA